MEAVLPVFQPGVIPHYFTVQTLAHISTNAVFHCVPYLKAILTSCLPTIAQVKTDSMKTVFANGRFLHCTM